MNKIKKYLRRIIKLVGLDEMQILPGHLAFYFIFLIIPICSFIALLAHAYSIDINNLLSNNIPMGALTVFDDFITPSYNLLVFLILSLWLSSKGCQAIIISSNIIFKIKDKNTFNIRIKSILMVLILFILISFVFIFPLLGDKIMYFLTLFLKDNSLNIIKNIYDLLKYPISLLLMFILLKSLYFMAPSRKIPNKYMNKGTIFTTLTWYFLSRGYSYYLNNYNKYNLYYGNIANILILLLWVYLLAYLFTIGIVLNADDYFISKLKINKNN